MNHLYLGAVAFGVTLLVASFFLSGHHGDGSDGGHHADGAPGLGWAPVMSLRFWVFLLTFGGGVGLALTELGSSELEAAIGAGAVGWVSGVLAVGIIRGLSKRSVSSGVEMIELVGATGTLVLPVGKDKPGKVRVDIKGRSEDFIANLEGEGGELPTGTTVMIVAEGERGTLLVAKHEM